MKRGTSEVVVKFSKAYLTRVKKEDFIKHNQHHKDKVDLSKVWDEANKK